MAVDYCRRDFLGLIGLVLLSPTNRVLDIQADDSGVSLASLRSLSRVVSQRTATTVRLDSLIESMTGDPSEWIVGIGSKLWFAKEWYSALGLDIGAVCREKRIGAACELDCQRDPHARGPGDHFVEVVVYESDKVAEQGWARSKQYLLDQRGESDRISDLEIVMVPRGDCFAQPKAFMRVANAIVCVVEPFSGAPNPRAFLLQVGKLYRSCLADAREGRTK